MNNRQKHTVTRQDWDRLVANLAPETQQILTETLDCYVSAPCVCYFADSHGRLDSESSPFYSDPLDTALEAADGDIDLA